MVVTQVWLKVQNGRTVVLEAEAARKQQRRQAKKRKASNHHHAPKRRKRGDAAAQVDADGDEEHGEHDENDQLFADAQAQLQQEMEAAGFGEDALPLSFGSSSSQPKTSTKKRKRQNQQRAEASAIVIEEPPRGQQAMEKVHVTFDSDGEIAERSVETVTVPAPAAEAGPVVIPVEEIAEASAAGDNSCPKQTEAVVTEPIEQPDVDPAVLKFWKQRRSLFHKYDEGIQLDHESWYSVTPESIAQYIAERCACDVIVDPFSGCGGNIIQFAKTCKQVIAIEIDAEKIRMAKANAAIYGVADRIEWIHGDALKVLPTLKADAVFLSPPWGGMNYNRSRFGVEEMMIGDVSGVELFKMARSVAKNVVYYLPKTTPEADLQALAPDEVVECEHIHLNGQLKVVNAYYGELVNLSRDSRDDSRDEEIPAKADSTAIEITQSPPPQSEETHVIQ